MNIERITPVGDSPDVAGQRFGSLLAIAPIGYLNRKVQWLCQCDCGTASIVFVSHLLGAKISSCGCSRPKKNVLTDGLSGTHLYQTWNGMCLRCTDPSSIQWHRYGGRGITVHPDWLRSFLTWRDDVIKMENCGREGYSFDRVDNEGNYEPGNVRWADSFTQGNNRSDNHWIEFDGERRTVTEWAREFELHPSVVLGRIRCGWAFEDAVLTPVGATRSKRAIHHVFRGVEKPLSVWAAEFGLSYLRVYKRLRLGWTLEKALLTPVPSRELFGEVLQ